MKREHESRVMMLDPNIRPGFIQDKDKHIARMERMIALADIVKLSDDDLAWFGETGSHADIAAKWLELGPKLVIVTGGSKGATGYTKDHQIPVASDRVTVVDTVGAGDTFNAGVLASLHEQHLLSKEAIGKLSETQIHKALTLGAKAAAITVSRAAPTRPGAAK
jgi:fructokinase